MDDTNKLKSRRDFLTITNSKESKKLSAKNSSDESNNDKIKMLTADGELVEVDKSVVANATERKKASYKDIHEWVTINPDQS